MAYKAYLNNTELFFDSSLGDDSFLLSAARLDMQAGAAGSFSYTVPPTNEYYDQFHRLTDYIDVFRDDERIFSGRVYSLKKIFDTQYQIVCEGLLAVLNDTIFRPKTFQGYLYGLVREIIDSHNSQVDEEKFILIDSITVSDSGVYRDYMNYETSISRLQDLAATFGGYMQLEKDYDESYIAIADIAIADLAIADKATGTMLKFSWFEDFTTGCDQKIELASNLLDIQKELNSDDVITVLIPLGAENEDGERLTIKSVNGGLDYLTAGSAYIDQYGYVTGVHEWDDVTTAAELKTKGQTWLNACLTPKISINLSAVDLADAGYSVESFRIGQKITVTSEPHDLNNQQFNCTTQVLDLLRPSQNRLTLGETQISYTTAQRANSPEAVIQKVSQTFVSKSALQQAVDEATNRIIGNDGGYVVIHDSDGNGEPDEILIMDTPNINTAVKVWRWNQAGLGYSSNGYSGTYGLAMIDGQIVANYITTGVMSAARIKAGILQSEDANAYWNLDTGYLSITKGQIQIETSSETSDQIKLVYGTKFSTMRPQGFVSEDTSSLLRAEYFNAAAAYKYNSVQRTYIGLGQAGGDTVGLLRLYNQSSNKIAEIAETTGDYGLFTLYDSSGTGTLQASGENGALNLIYNSKIRGSFAVNSSSHVALLQFKNSLENNVVTLGEHSSGQYGIFNLYDSTGTAKIQMAGASGSINSQIYQIAGTTIRDYLVGISTYTSTYATWICRRWNSGFVELIGSRTFTANINTAWGNIYEGQLGYVTFPITFQTTPYAVYSLQQSSVGCWLEWTGTTDTTTTPTFYGCRATTGSVSLTLSIYACGTEAP